jgi:RNA polymerase sporulation-specific sigma factor
MADEELIVQSQHGCGRAIEFLLGRYRGLVEGKARAYFLMGADHDDVVQEGMIGLFKAIRDFSSEHLCAFRSFAELCVTRQIITAVKTATRQKHAVLNHYLSLESALADEEGERTLEEVLPLPLGEDPGEAIAGRAAGQDIRARIRQELSPLESQALLRYIEGESYQDIAGSLGRQVKQIDNALQRAKKKLMRRVQANGAQASPDSADASTPT